MTRNEQSLTVTVLGMSCGHCKTAIERALHELSAVHEVNVDLQAKRVTVRGCDLDLERVRAALDDAGYLVRS